MERRHMAPTRADQTDTSRIPGLLQRDCAYGSAAGMDGECAGCRSTRLRGSPGQPSRPRAIPTIVHEALGSPGEMLSPRILKFMAVRFGGVSRVASPGSTAPASVSRATLTLNRPGDFFEQGPSARRRRWWESRRNQGRIVRSHRLLTHFARRGCATMGGLRNRHEPSALGHTRSGRTSFS
jgi:hypothetical protein